MDYTDGVPRLLKPTYRERLSGWSEIHIPVRTLNWLSYFDYP